MPAENAHIADVATGTGVWMLELQSSSDSTYRFDGFDISSAQFPPADGLPTNVTFNVADCKQGFPPQFHNRYHVVHIRLVVAVMHEDDWALVARNVMQLLRPGGAIMWVEPHARQLRTVLRSKPSARSTVLHSTSNTIIDLVPWADNDCVPNISKVLAEVGYTDCLTDVVSSDCVEGGRRATTINHIGTNMAVVGMLRESGAPGDWSVETWAHKQKEMVEEMESGAYYREDIYVSVGFKP